ncbi:hypothetical protein EDC96DRAFT_596090 [Choanephora cucurbitarum]|nr:hypothetical protein EDC96DRAFT_596090 [Choanephora cucurbitarum]
MTLDLKKPNMAIKQKKHAIVLERLRETCSFIYYRIHQLYSLPLSHCPSIWPFSLDYKALFKKLKAVKKHVLCTENMSGAHFGCASYKISAIHIPFAVVIETEHKETKHNEIKHNESGHKEIKHNEFEHNESEHKGIKHNVFEHNKKFDDIENEYNEIKANEIQSNEVQFYEIRFNEIDHYVFEDTKSEYSEINHNETMPYKIKFNVIQPNEI